MLIFSGVIQDSRRASQEPALGIPAVNNHLLQKPTYPSEKQRGMIRCPNKFSAIVP